MKRKLIACLMILVITASVLAGCAALPESEGAQAPAPASDFTGKDPQLEKHMKISAIWAKDNGNGALINRICRDYQEKVNPNFTWEYEYIPSEDLITRIRTLADSNDLPDIFAYESGKPIAELIKGDKIVDIGAELARTGSTDFVTPAATSLLETLSDTDTIYDLPLGLNVEGFWYNKALFEQAGVEVPATMDEFEAVLKTLYDAGIQPLAAAGASGETWEATRIVNAITVRTVGNDAMKKAADGEARYTDPGYAAAAQKVADWAAAGYFGEDVNTVTTNAAGHMLMNGHAAIFYNGSWFAGSLNSEDNKAGKDGIGFFNIPVADPSISDIDSYSMNCGTVLCFDKAGYDDGAAWFMKYFVEHIGDAAMETEGTVKGYTYSAQADNMSGYTKLVLDEIGKAQSAFTWYEAMMDTEVSKTALENVQLLLTGGMTGEEYMTSIQKADDAD